jgi:putative transposase
MKQAGLTSKVKRKYRVTTDSNHSYPIVQNHLNRNFTPSAPNQSWVSDITYIRTKQGWLYLTILLDLFNRKVIGWALGNTMKTSDTIIPAWKMAIANNPITSELTFHSDRGVQYASNEFRMLINSNPLIKQSMSRKANCSDNAVAESFFKTLKVECVYHQKYNTVQEAGLSVFEYIETWYNSRRLHSSLGYLTPTEFDDKYYQLKNVA